MSTPAGPDKTRAYIVTFRDGKKYRVRASDGAAAKRAAVRKRYNPGTLPDQIEKSKNVSDVSDVSGSEK